MLDVGDRLAIHELLALYGHLIDERRWDELDRVFTDDVVYDARDFDIPVTRSLAELVAEWTSEAGMARHPLAHHASNVVVTEDDDGTVRVLSKGIGVAVGGRVGSVTYRDVAVRVPGGWRLASRTVTLRRPRGRVSRPAAHADPMVDAHFAEPRLAGIYDPLDPDRSDLDVYAALVDELGAGSVLDVGCGTGTFACLLEARGKDVTGVDPAAASLAVARAKPGADRVRWLHGDATMLPPLAVDVATMTGNVAQVFVGDDDWAATLRGIRAALRPGGWLVFEVRDPAPQAWRGWTGERTHRRVELPDAGAVETWIELTDVRPPLVSFRTTFAFEADGAVLTADSTLRFRTRAEVADSLGAAGFAVHDVRDAPDRPGQELVPSGPAARRPGGSAAWWLGGLVARWPGAPAAR